MRCLWLPAALNEEIEHFFRAAIENLASRIGGPDAKERAFRIFATLEGGLILARAYGDVGAFDLATASLSIKNAPKFAPD